MNIGRKSLEGKTSLLIKVLNSINVRLKYLIFIVFIVIGVLPSASQEFYNITGIISNDIDGAVPDASIYIMDMDSNFVAVSISDSTGYFSIKYPTKTKGGVLNIIHMLYENYSEPLINKEDLHKEILLDIKSVYELEEIVVSAKKPAFRVDNSNIVAKVASIPGVSQMSSGKLLQRLPGVSESSDGNYALNGVDAVIYINGIRQNLTEKALKGYLESLPTTAVLEIELLQSPPANYDSNVQAAINIIIDKGKDDGMIFNIGLFTGEQKGYLGNTGLDAFFMIKSNNILFSTTLNYSNVNLLNSGWDSTLYAKNRNSPIVNNNKNTGRDNQISLNSNLTIALKDDSNLDFNASIFYGLSNSKYKNRTAVYDLMDDSYIEKQYKTNTDGYDDLYTFTAKYSSDKNKKFSFISYYNGLYGSIKSKNKYNILESSDSWIEYMYSNIGMEGQMHSFGSDFINKISNLALIYGAKLDHDIIYDKITYEITETNLDNSRFKGKEFIAASYAGLEYKKNNLSLSATVRSEYTNYELNLKSDNYKAKDNYFNFFPKFRLTYKWKSYTASLFYNSFIQRQNYLYLLPGERYVNEYQSSVGNPELKPILVDILGLHNNFFGGAFSILVQYQNIKDEYERVLIEKDSKTIECPLNYSDRKNVVLHINIPIILFKNRLSGNLSYTNVFFNKYKNINPELLLSNDRTKKYRKSNVDFKFQYEVTDYITIDYLLNYIPNYKSIVYEKSSLWRSDFGISYSFPQNKSFVLSADIKNIFDSYNDNRLIFFGNSYRYSEINGNGPIFSISFKYKFNKGNNINNKYKDSRPDISRMSK